jgi:hypothetical protein
MTFDPSVLRRVDPSRLGCELALPGRIGVVQLLIECSDRTPQSYQTSAVEELISRWESVVEQLKLPLFAYYRDALVGSSESGPRIADANLVWDHVSIHEVTVPSYNAEGNRYIDIAGGCSWEEEHGLEIALRNSDYIMYVGQYGGREYEEPRKAVSWNFADPNTQSKALSAEFFEPLEPEELEEFAVSQKLSESESQVFPQVAARKPWWRLW